MPCIVKLTPGLLRKWFRVCFAVGVFVPSKLSFFLFFVVVVVVVFLFVAATFGQSGVVMRE